jgi:hypothetical protein
MLFQNKINLRYFASGWFYVKTEADTAVIELLMMGEKTPETC